MKDSVKIIVDVEADGPCPSLYSMISLGAIVLDENLDKTFYTTFSPISDYYVQQALDVSGYTREETMQFTHPKEAIQKFDSWIKEVCNGAKPMFFSDNNGFDWQFVNWYFHYYLGNNPFGHSSTNIGSLYKGMQKNMKKNFKHLRKTKHTHHPVDDAKGNAEALLAMKKMGLLI